MIWAIILGAALEAGFGLLAAVGFEDELRDLKGRLLKGRLTKAGERKRNEAFAKALADASIAIGDESITLLLTHRTFQEEVIGALLDPVAGMDMSAVASGWEGKLPQHARSLRKFFSDLETALLMDDTWGPMLERFQEVRFRQDVQAALAEHRLDVSPHELVHSLNARLSGGGAMALEVDASTQADNEDTVATSRDVHQIVQIYVQEMVIGLPIKTASLRQRYLREVAEECNLLPWGALNVVYADPSAGEDLRLADVYTKLDTTELKHIKREEELREFLAHIHEHERVAAQEVANRERRLLIMGDPGSGKSTFVKYVAYVLAQAGLAPDPSSWLARLAPWEHETLLPVYVELRQVAAFADDHRSASGTLLLSYLHHLVETWELEAFWPEMDGLLRDGEGGMLFLFDGLDEVPTAQRQLVVDAVNAFCSRRGKHRFVVTCRPYAYIGQPWQLRRFYETTLAPFSDEQIDNFVSNWYEQLAERGRLKRSDAGERARQLQQAVLRSDLRGLAERPLLLTVMAQLHTFAGKLPEDRTQLYADAVQLLLQRWEQRTHTEGGVLDRLNLPDLKMSDLEAGLYEVAFRAQAAGRLEGTADVDEANLRSWLAPYLGGDWNRAGTFVEYIRERAGLLVRHKTDAYTFPHRSFQEFLAACHLLGESDYPTRAAHLLCEDMDRWREVFILAAGHAARTLRLGQAIAAVNSLCPLEVARSQPHTAQDLETARIAGEALLEIGLIGVRRETVGQAVLERVRNWLIEAMRRDDVLQASQRAAAGNTLGRLGDPRPEVLDPLQMAFVDVPAGPFTMGGTEYADEQPVHAAQIPEAYRIGHFPVTNAQYRAFVDAGGYGQERYWSEAKTAGWWENGKAIRGLYRVKEEAGRYSWELVDKEEGDRPRDFGEPYGLPNHPVVGVTWYEALAFGRWLTERMSSSGLLAAGWEVRLPSEAEWEKAARGTEGREFPWLGDADPNRANYSDTKIGTTSAVGCFPGGASPFEAEEMSGNVWEWTASLWGKNPENPDFSYPYDRTDGREQLDAGSDVFRVLRGGSFLYDYGFVRCAVRGRFFPSYGGDYFGLRVVLSPSASGL